MVMHLFSGHGQMCLRASLAVLLAGTALNLASPGLARAELVQWPGNRHFYDVVEVPEGITWLDAQAAAQSRGGYLASLTTREENRFVWSLIARHPRFWTTSLRRGKPDQSDRVGPWIGLVQKRHQAQEPSGGWQWVSGEPFRYASWGPGKPNNLEEIEDYGDFFIVDGSNNEATWNDFSNDPLKLKTVQARRPVAYIVEFDSDPRR